VSALGGQSNVANLLSALDGPALQSLLGVLQHNPAVIQAAQHQYSPSHSNPTDLASLLGNVVRQNNHLPPTPTTIPTTIPTTNQGYGLQMSNPSLVADPNLASLLAKGLGGQAQAQQLGSHVKNIMDQLTKLKQ
jgi:hypothetical protein